MADILIRDVSDEVVAAINANAKRSKLSRAEYLRRLLDRERARAGAADLTVEDLRQLSERCADALDPDFIASAWR